MQHLDCEAEWRIRVIQVPQKRYAGGADFGGWQDGLGQFLQRAEVQCTSGEVMVFCAVSESSLLKTSRDHEKATEVTSPLGSVTSVVCGTESRRPHQDSSSSEAN